MQNSTLYNTVRIDVLISLYEIVSIIAYYILYKKHKQDFTTNQNYTSKNLTTSSKKFSTNCNNLLATCNKLDTNIDITVVMAVNML